MAVHAMIEAIDHHDIGVSHPDAGCCCAQIDDGRLEESLGFPQFTSGEPRLGWLMNFNAVRRATAARSAVLQSTTCIDLRRLPGRHTALSACSSSR